MNKAPIAPNIEIAYTDSGKGKETILFIHGLASYTGVWRKNIPELSKNYRCIALDLPGNGHSSKGDYPFSMFFYAESVVKFIQHLELTEVNICGHSMGGQIAQIIALRYPALVKRLILAAPAGFEFYSNQDKMIVKNMMLFGNFIYSDESHLTTAIHESFETYPLEANEMIADLKALLFRDNIRDYRSMLMGSINGMIDEQIFEFLPQLTCKVLVFFGKKDRLIPNKLIHLISTEDMAAKACARIPNSQLVLFNQCGHFLQWEKADEFNAAVKKFVQE